MPFPSLLLTVSLEDAPLAQVHEEKGYPIKSLVAFSGTVTDDKLPGKTYTEAAMNGGIGEGVIPLRFATPEFQVLLVADKYQTGFDQPLLHTMYVDKRLAGIQAVQTLSRLNRVHPLKEDTFVLDFRNDRQEIQDAFKQFYDGALLGEAAEPAQLYWLKDKLDASGVYLWDEVQRFCAVFFKPQAQQVAGDHTAMNAALDPAVERFRTLLKESEEEAEQWRSRVTAFRNLYAFLSQVMPYTDSDLERLYTFLRFLAPKLPHADVDAYRFDDDVRLKYYRLQLISEGGIDLRHGEARPLDGPTEVGSGAAREEPVPLSRLIDVINERLGTDFGEGDQLFFDQLVESAVQIEHLQQAARANPPEKFQLLFRQALESLFIERMDLNGELFARFLGERDFNEVLAHGLGDAVYQRLQRPSESPMGPYSET